MTDNTQPEALIDLIDAYAETRHRYGRIHNAKTEAARKAVIEALSGVQALSAAPAVPAGACGYFSFSDECGFDRHDTADAAKAAATEMLVDIRRELGGEEWPMNVESICWGVVVERAAEHETTTGEDGEKYCDYALKGASPTPPAEQKATKETSGGFHVWRDISTAPKDGSRFVVTGHNYGLYSEVRHTCVAQWFRGCWMEASDWNETSELKYLTHWMPLPSPPDDVAAPAEQQAQTGAVYAELPDSVAWLAEYGGDIFTAAQLISFADRTHAARLRCKSEQARLATLWGYVRADAAPKAAPGVGNSGFDHKTAADFLNNKIVSDEAVRNFVAASRWAHDERAALSATLLAMHGVLTSREAEIALLKKALLEAEAAPQQEAQEPVAYVEVSQSDAEVSMTWGPEPAGFNLPTGRYALYTTPQPSPAPLSECLRLLNSFEYEGDEDSQAKAFFKAHINEDWFFHVKNSLELAIAAQGGKDA